MKWIATLIVLLGSANSWSAEIYFGPLARLGQGSIRAFVKSEKKSNQFQMGVAISEGALQDLPHQKTSVILEHPQIKSARPFDHIVVDWEPHGHEPNGIYNVPHFDIHFYFIDESIRKNITCQGSDAEICKKQPPAKMIPPHYAPTPEGTPEMGWHWFDTRAPEVNGGKFTSTFIYGFYNGQLTFLEPMVTREFLLAKKNFAANIPQPPMYARSKIFPKSYFVQYDPQRRLYLITVENKARRCPVDRDYLVLCR